MCDKECNLLMGIFGSDYSNTGVGIPKNAPKKKGAARFFELLIRKFWKLIQINVLYFVFFIPLFIAGYVYLRASGGFAKALMICFCLAVFAAVIGPATAGMMKILRNYTIEKNAFILTDFKKAFVENYKKAFVMGLIDIIAAISIASAVSVYPQLAKIYGNAMMVLFVISVSVGLILIMMNFYTFLMIAATELSLKNILKNSFALACAALKKNLLTLLISFLTAAVFAGLVIWNKSMILFLPFVPASIIAFVICFNSYPVIQKYIINPYYEQKGEVNPELAAENGDETLFEDKGGMEKPVKKKKDKKAKGKIIS